MGQCLPSRRFVTNHLPSAFFRLLPEIYELRPYHRSRTSSFHWHPALIALRVPRGGMEEPTFFREFASCILLLAPI